MERAGTMPKARGEVVLSRDEKLAIKSADAGDLPSDFVSDMEVMRRRLEIRARAMAMLELTKHSAYRSLHDRYYGKMLGEVPEGMRAPTIQEVRRYDRTMHEEVLRQRCGKFASSNRPLPGHGRRWSVEAP